MLTDAEIALLKKTASCLTDLELAQVTHILALRAHVMANEITRRWGIK